jgi:hypothetical protein
MQSISSWIIFFLQILTTKYTMKSIILEGATKILGQLSRILHHPENKNVLITPITRTNWKKKMKNKIKPTTQSQRKETNGRCEAKSTEISPEHMIPPFL